MDLRKIEEQQEVRDFRSEEVLDLRKKEDREVQDSRKEEAQVLGKEDSGLRKEDSDDDLLNIEEEVREPTVPMTPKKLVVIGNPASPRTTSFDWMVEQGEEDKEVQQVLAGTGSQGAEFLDKVEDLFHKEPESL